MYLQRSNARCNDNYSQLAFKQLEQCCCMYFVFISFACEFGWVDYKLARNVHPSHREFHCLCWYSCWNFPIPCLMYHRNFVESINQSMLCLFGMHPHFATCKLVCIETIFSMRNSFDGKTLRVLFTLPTTTYDTFNNVKLNEC